MLRGAAIVVLFGLGMALQAQTSPGTWWVRFSDKANTPFSIDQPEAYLSSRAIQRRLAQGIPVDELDLPVDPAYISAVLATGDVQLHNRSKWFNAITIRTNDADALEAIASLPFVVDMRGAGAWYAPLPTPDKFTGLAGETRDLDYGGSFGQIAMMNGHLLHAMDAQGQGMLIGVLDSGFDGVDVHPAFEALRSRGGILYTSDQVDHDGDVYQDHWHGRSVLGCIAGHLPGTLIGTAPMADHVLVRTEEAATEFVVEEDNWVSGAELCDSLGVDILNTSLGYTVFQDSTQDHSYADMNGATTRISIAAGIASQKGMVPVVSAGNQGAQDWYYISAPADAFDILAVGAVGAQEQAAWFSSHGPSADGRVKPDVAAMGWGTTGISPDGQDITLLNGTSFSAPLVAGLVACLWQLHPQRSAQDVMDAVRRSASLYDTPDAQLGHGIPDFMLAHQLLEMTTATEDRPRDRNMRVYPVPFDDRLVVEVPNDPSGPVEFSLLDMAGRLVWTHRAPGGAGTYRLQGSGLHGLAPGGYLLRMNGAPVSTVLKVQP